MDLPGKGRLLEQARLNSTIPPPTAEAQLAFLAKIQRLFAEGDFTATYKFALLISLADLAVEVGSDDGAELTLTNREIADRFVQLYWRHSTPYGTGRTDTQPGVLVQNLGDQAAVLTAICEYRASTPGITVQQARTEPSYAALRSKVAAVISAQPLNYLQNFGGVTDTFLYERSGRGAIALKPGVAYCLRRFYTLVQQLSRTHWVDHIKTNRRNHTILGDAGDLEDFLFSASRQSLAIVGAELRKLDGHRCFYCGGNLTGADVDHFVPFSLYPRDQAHNFVLAHPACNRSKSDTLGAKPHLEKWLERLVTKSDEISEIGALAGMASDGVTANRVAAWGYAIAHTAGGRAWLSATSYEPVTQSYLALFNA
ncbi:HNH endonuclease [Paraburkholderia sp. 31.1]|uniref:HNH endonuclease n=1 Tax=Paraburkholderia sp. 31.1 TaxID=2615205 RepID=UPI001655A75A|nr:HNH endonuclease [Paraburkholderia sp. 31.1]MBC8723119.1 HNH endonuclease [Paraburkholderia sp. 31.1]